jgi:hypothetical protein
MQKTLTLKCVVAALMIWIFLGASAMADDIYGTYRLDETEFARIAEKSHIFKISVWKKNKDIVETPSYSLKVDKNNRRYARIDHYKKLRDKGVMLANASSPKQDEKKVLGIYRLDQKDAGNVYKNNVFVWLKKPKSIKTNMKLVKSGDKITLVHVDQKPEEKYKDIQLAKKSIGH